MHFLVKITTDLLDNHVNNVLINRSPKHQKSRLTSIKPSLDKLLAQIRQHRVEVKAFFREIDSAFSFKYIYSRSQYTQKEEK